MNKNSSRRKFIKNGAMLSAGLPLLNAPTPNYFSQNSGKIEKAKKPMKILILGGTSFLGPHQIAYALERGHSISTFTRGKSVPKVHQELLKNCESLIGDREDNLEALKGRKWDVVIDNSGRKVKWTEDTAALLKDNAEMYMYVSSVSVFFPYTGSDYSEERELVLEAPDTDLYKNNKETFDYGIMKANSENATIKAFGKDRSIVIRPHFIVGPGDPTDRFTYWVERLPRGGEIVLPGSETDRVQYIDVRDLAGFMIRLLEDRVSGTFNASGPEFKMTMPQFVYGAHAAFNSPVSFVKISDVDFLEENKLFYLNPWILPKGIFEGMALAENQKVIDAGMTFTPLAKTVRDLYEWWISDIVPAERHEKMISGEYSFIAREAEIIKKWRARKAEIMGQEVEKK